eukprot:819272-Amphidinium_carterae.1
MSSLLGQVREIGYKAPVYVANAMATRRALNEAEDRPFVIACRTYNAARHALKLMQDLQSMCSSKF